MRRTFSKPVSVAALAGLCLSSVALATAAAPPATRNPSAVVAEALAGPMKNVRQIVFAVRLPYDDPHWYANIGYYCDDEHHKAYAGNGKPDAGKLCLLDVPYRQDHSPSGCPGRLGAGPAGPLRWQEDSVRVPPERHGLLPPLRNQRRRLRPAANHVGRVRRLRADLPSRRRDHLRLHALPLLGKLLDDPGGRAPSLRGRRPQYSADLLQRRTRQYALDVAGRPHPLHALGICRSQPGGVPPPLDHEPGWNRANDLLRQHAPGHCDARRQADSRHAADHRQLLARPRRNGPQGHRHDRVSGRRSRRSQVGPCASQAPVHRGPLCAVGGLLFGGPRQANHRSSMAPATRPLFSPGRAKATYASRGRWRPARASL